ncbi:TPA: hypothetical protein SI878_004405 [Salmonella enterica]|nr:hypothetical protein [Salmonella enterica]
MALDKDLNAKEFNDKVAATIGAIRGTPKALVALVAAAGYRFYGKDSGSTDVIKNFVNGLAEYSNIQAKAIKAFKTFANIEFTQTDDSKGKDTAGKAKPKIYTVENLVKISDMDKTQKDSYQAAIKAFEALNLDSLNDYAKSTSTPAFDFAKKSKSITNKVENLILDAIKNDPSLNVDQVVADLTSKIAALRNDLSLRQKVAALKPVEAQEPAPQPETV